MKKFLVITVSVLFIGFGALVVFITTLDVNQYKSHIVAAIEGSTGRDFDIKGDISVKLSVIPTLSVEGVSFGNAGWAAQDMMASADRFEAQMRLIPLLSGRISIRHILFKRARVFLESNSEGLGNWVLSLKDKSAVIADDAELPAFDIQKISIKDAIIHYRPFDADASVLSVGELDINTNTSDKLLNMKLSAQFNEIAFSVSGEIAPIERFVRNEPYAIDIKISAEDIEVGMAGTVGKPLTPAEIALEFELAMTSTATLSDLIEYDISLIAPVSVGGELHDDKGVFIIEKLQTSLGTSDIGGRIEINLNGQKPAITTQLESKFIDLSPFESSQAQTSSDRVFSTEPLPFDFLKEFNVSAGFTIDELRTTKASAESISANLKLEAGKLNITDISGALSGAPVTGEIKVDVSGQIPRFSQRVTVQGLAIAPFLNGEDDNFTSGGIADLDAQISGQGISVAEIMGNSNGRIKIEVEGLVITNRAAELASGDIFLQAFDILNPLSQSDDKTVIECAVVNFPIKGGAMRSDTGLGVSTRKLNILGGGTVNFKTEQIDIGVNPKPREGVGLNVSNLANFVRLGGTLANPKPTTDTMGAASAGVKVTAAIATGGLSILAEGLLDRASSDVNVCAIARGDIAPPTAAKTAGNSASKIKDVAGQAVEKTTNVLKGAGSKAKSVFKGLFGD